MLRPPISLRVVSLTLLLAASLTPSAADAQRTAGRIIRIAYEPGNASRNGYMDAQVEVTYYFGRCADNVAFLATYDAVPRMLVGNHRYWVDGRQVEVPPHIAPPRLEKPVIRGTIRGNGISKEINYLYASASSAGCLVEDMPVGPVSQFWPANTPEDRRLAILNGFALDQRGSLPPLRNPAVESHFRQQFAAQREDSLRRVRAAEAQRLAARQDSVNRAQAARARQDSLARAEQQRRAGSAGAAGTAAGAAAGTAGRTGSTGSTGSTAGANSAEAREAEQARAEQEAAARAQADREQAARAAAEAQRQAAEQAAQQEAMAEAMAVTAVAVVGIVSSIAESRRLKREREARAAEQRAREAAARYAAYAAEAKARFDAAPSQPQCTVADVADTVTISKGKVTTAVNLTGTECRAAGGQSMVLLALDVRDRLPITFTVSSQYGAAIALSDQAGRRVMPSEASDGKYHLNPGKYLLAVSSQLPGEVGTGSITTAVTATSDQLFGISGGAGSSKTIEGFARDPRTGAQLFSVFGGWQRRVGQPYLIAELSVGPNVDSQEGLFDVGLRHYFGSLTRRWRPWVQGTIGYRSIHVLEEPFTGFGPGLSAGVDFRVTPTSGLGMSLAYYGGSTRNTDDVWTSPPPPVPFGRTLLRFDYIAH